MGSFIVRRYRSRDGEISELSWEAVPANGAQYPKFMGGFESAVAWVKWQDSWRCAARKRLIAALVSIAYGAKRIWSYRPRSTWWRLRSAWSEFLMELTGEMNSRR